MFPKGEKYKCTTNHQSAVLSLSLPAYGWLVVLKPTTRSWMVDFRPTKTNHSKRNGTEVFPKGGKYRCTTNHRSEAVSPSTWLPLVVPKPKACMLAPNSTSRFENMWFFNQTPLADNADTSFRFKCQWELKKKRTIFSNFDPTPKTATGHTYTLGTTCSCFLWLLLGLGRW